jgi:hypothetical protein
MCGTKPVLSGRAAGWMQEQDNAVDALQGSSLQIERRSCDIFDLDSRANHGEINRHNCIQAMRHSSVHVVCISTHVVLLLVYTIHVRVIMLLLLLLLMLLLCRM